MYKSYSDLGQQPDQNVDHYSVHEITDMADKQNIIRNNYVVCIDIFASWCHVCTVTAPDYSMLAKKYNEEGRCMFVKELFDKKLTNPAPTGLPTYQIFVGGRKMDDIVGGNIPEVEKKVLSYLNGQQQYGQQDNREMYTSGPNANKSTIRTHKNINQTTKYGGNNHSQDLSQYNVGGYNDNMPNNIPQGPLYQKY